MIVSFSLKEGDLQMSESGLPDERDDVADGGCGCDCPSCDNGYHCYQPSQGCKN